MIGPTTESSFGKTLSYRHPIYQVLAYLPWKIGVFGMCVCFSVCLSVCVWMYIMGI